MNRSKKYQGFVYYLGGVMSVLAKIEAEFGVNINPAARALLQVKASMRDKFLHTKVRKLRRKGRKTK